MRLGAALEIENEGDLLDLVLEEPQDLERLRFRWSQVGFDMGNDGLAGALSESDLNNHMEFLSTSLPNLTELVITLFPSHMVNPEYGKPRKQFLFIAGFLDSPCADLHLSWEKLSFSVRKDLLKLIFLSPVLLFRLKSIKLSLSHHAHLGKVAELLAQTKNLDSLVLEHLQLPQSQLVVK